MGRKRKSGSIPFLQSSKEQLLAYNVGHSWFDSDDNVCDIVQSDQLPDEFDQQFESASSKKFCSTSATYNLKNGHRIVDINVLSVAMSHFAVCFLCKKGTLSITETPIAGWAIEMGLLCSNQDCRRSNVDNIEKFCSSTTDDQGHAHVVNRNMVLGMRNIGRGWSAAMKFSAVMGLPKPISRPAFASQTQFWKNSAEQIVKKSMVAAAKDVYDMHTIPEENDSDSETSDSETTEAGNIDQEVCDREMVRQGDGDHGDGGIEVCDRQMVEREDRDGDRGIEVCDEQMVEREDRDHGDGGIEVHQRQMVGQGHGDHGDGGMQVCDRQMVGQEDHDGGIQQGDTEMAEQDERGHGERWIKNGSDDGSEAWSDTADDDNNEQDRVNDSGSDSNSDEDSFDDATIKNCSISIDGSWLTRGFASKHGFVSVISTETGKVLDMIYLCSTCRGCNRWKDSNRDNQDYLEWFTKHEKTCPLNHEGSAQSMEAAGAVVLFQRSERLYNLRYKYFIGDGDSKGYAKVVAAQPYGPTFNILKKECVGHVQKRMGTRLRKLIAKNKGRKLSDGKGLQGVGRLTETRINAFQNFYGSAIRNNKGDLEAMTAATMAILSHYSSLEPVSCRHDHCPQSVTSWCKYQADIARGDGHTTYKPVKNPLPPAVYDELLPTFTALSDPKLLSGCLDGLTQNANESLHHNIWNLVPKEQFHSPSEVSVGISLAVTAFNDGWQSTMAGVMGMSQSQIVTGHSRFVWDTLDQKRITEGNRANDPQIKLKRKERRKASKKTADGFHAAEGVTYAPGEFYGDGSKSTHTRPQRKQPVCSKCGQLRKGHPKKGCTNV